MGGTGATRVAVAILAAALPLVGLASLLLRSQLDPHFENYRAHFVVFGIVGAVAFILGYAAGEAANRRRDARVLLLSLALAWLLDQALNTALAFAIVGVMWVVAALILQRTGRAALGRIRGLPTTRDTIKEDVEWAKAQKS